MSGKRGQKSRQPAIRTGYEPATTLDRADQRLRMVRLAQERAEIMESELGSLTAAKRMLIRRTVIMDMRLQQLEAEFLTTGNINVGEYTALSNSCLGLLRTLGIERQAKPVKRLTEILAEQRP